ncbi:hypothetical protein P872_00555 [Rhodonellum psychrophilum GCM71 = DSM 17998]|uniref:Anhydro-N-acetylmuramic acid kinase n=2 Tax=Rhodonellum TaxID=336827 RepID=U5C528_9BACT|nr:MULTISPECIES: anhydro-N-acetylmuramic acid kinase [Rhodonellum]ERM84031.1 hypothetical protein P872_00555 [Rhodonellum psychrophilum GCM71 = DSM 17998]SDY39968.1 anhydro-N-acetylmuramic acid kinase [Rhodonellum ikkaensis]
MMTKNQYQTIGLMSGTSGDGLDIAYCEFEKTESWQYKILRSETVPFPKKMGKELQNSHKLKGLKLSHLDVAFGKWMGEMVREFCGKNHLQPEFVSSHGHTVFHQPAKGLSLQIGNGWALHQASGLPVINDFRMLDVQLGGQGAPLVPIGDQLLFSKYDYCLNLGGIANISMEKGGLRTAFDICPFNLLLNHFAGELGSPFDKDGAFARSGKLLPKLMETLNDIPFYRKIEAKSLGREDIAHDFMKILTAKSHQPENILHTLALHFTQQIIRTLWREPGKQQSLLVTGGGAFNTFFMEKLQEELGNEILIEKADPQIIGFKEALIFAFLGVLKVRGENNCLASVTGASRDNSGGSVFGM